MQSRTNQNVHTAQSSKRKRIENGGGKAIGNHQNADLKIEDGEEHPFIHGNYSHSKLPSTAQGGKRRIEARIQSFNFKIKGNESS